MPAVLLAADLSVRELHRRMLGPIGRGERFLDQVSWELADALLWLPVAALALGVGLLAWRGRRPLAGVVAALAVQVAAFTDLWPELVQTASAAVVVAVVSAPITVAVSAGARLVLPRAPGMLGGRRVLAPLAAGLAPVAVLLLAFPTGNSWLLAVSAVGGVVAGILIGSLPRASWPVMALSQLSTAFALVLLAGVLGGPGIGAALPRMAPTPQTLPIALHLLVALGAACVTLLAVWWSLAPREVGAAAEGGQPGDGSGGTGGRDAVAVGEEGASR